MRSALRAIGRRLFQGSSGGPDPAARAKTTSEIIAIAYDEVGHELTTVRFAGINSYEFSASVLAWGASAAAEGRVGGVGALGPVEAFGLKALEVGLQ
jgi:hypothetical protein